MSQNSYYSELVKNHKWNSIMNILDGSFFQMGFACFVPAVIMVAYLSHYTDNEFLLNLPVFIGNFAGALGPFIMSFYSGRIKRKKRATVISSFWHRASWLPVILVVYFLSDSKKLIIPAFLISYTVFYIVWGISGIFWQEMMGRALVPEKFSSAMGMREAISRIAGFIAGLGAAVILAKVAYPDNFIILFIITFIMWFISWFWISRIKEAPYDGTVNESSRGHLKNLFLLPAKDKAFRWYIVFIFFVYGYLFVGSLYTVVGIERFKNHMGQDQLTGVISIITILSSSFFALIAGRVSERAGKFWGFLIFTSINIILPVSMTFCYNYYFYIFLIFLSGISYIMWLLEFTTLMGFSAPERRHEYIAFVSLIKLIPIVIYTNLGGYLASTVSPGAAFIVSSAFCTLALLILFFKLRPLWAADKIIDG